MTQSDLRERIASKEIIVMDGAMGSELMKHPEYAGNLPSNLNIDHPEIATAIHRAYVEAGAEMIITMEQLHRVRVRYGVWLDWEMEL